MGKQIYLDEEDKAIFDELFGETKENFSQWIREKMRDEKVKRLDSQFILNKITLLDNQIQDLISQKEGLKEQLRKAEKFNKEKTRAEAQKQELENRGDLPKEIDRKTRTVMQELERVKHPQWKNESFAKILATEFIEHESEYSHLRDFLQKKQVIEVKIK